MVYINSSTFVINSWYKHCIEAFEVTTIDLNTYTGVCGMQGSQLTGYRINDVRLLWPMGAAFDGSQMIYSSSSGHEKIIDIDMTSDMVYEVCGTSGMFATSLVFNHSSQSLFVALNHAVGRVEISTSEFTVLSGSATRGDSIGDLRTTDYSNPFGLLQVNASKLLISDRNNNR